MDVLDDRPHICDWEGCEKGFARKSDLARHEKIHTGQKDFVCPLSSCGKAFIQNSALVVHIRTHTGEKPHLCETCEKPFADSSSLARHRRTHNGNRPYPCPSLDCGKSFARRNTLLKHCKSLHPELPPPSSSAVRSDRALPRTHSAPDTFRSSTMFVKNSPHGFAAPQPPGCAAYPFDGRDNGPLSQLPLEQPDVAMLPERPIGRGRYPRGRFDGSGVRGRGLAIEMLPGGEPTRTPLSATSTSFTDLTSPATTFSVTGSIGQSPEQGFGGSSVIRRNAAAHLGPGHHHVHQDFSNQHHYAAPAYPQSMMFYKTPAHRSASAPFSRMPFESATYGLGNVGGGFSPSQLAYPQSLQQHHVYPAYGPATPGPQSLPITPRLEAADGPQARSAEREMREATPDPLVDLGAVPTFAFQPPPNSNTAMTGPHSAVELHHPTPFPGLRVLSVPSSQPERLRSAPPQIARFSSHPNLSATWSPCPGSPPNQSQSVATPMLLDTHGLDDYETEWRELEEQMISREASEGPEGPNPPAQEFTVFHEPVKSVRPNILWGEPITMPQHSAFLGSRQPLPYAGSNTSSASTLVSNTDFGNFVMERPPHVMLPPISTQTPPLSSQLSALYAPGASPAAYPTPVTPWSSTHHGYKPVHPSFSYSHPHLASPVDISVPMVQAVHHLSAAPSMMYPDVQDVTLTTPPQGSRRNDGVSQVGLGIANVHFDDERQAVIMADIEGSPVPEQSDMTGHEEQSSEDDEDQDAGADDDSDDDFVPGRKRVARKKGGKVGKGRVVVLRGRRKA